jgi:dienelactone hydrolase
MTTIQVSDEVIPQYGLEAVRERLQKQMQWEELQVKALKGNDFLQDNSLEHEQFVKEARDQAWKNMVQLY